MTRGATNQRELVDRIHDEITDDEASLEAARGKPGDEPLLVARQHGLAARLARDHASRAKIVTSEVRIVAQFAVRAGTVVPFQQAAVAIHTPRITAE